MYYVRIAEDASLVRAQVRDRAASARGTELDAAFPVRWLLRSAREVSAAGCDALRSSVRGRCAGSGVGLGLAIRMPVRRWRTLCLCIAGDLVELEARTSPEFLESMAPGEPEHLVATAVLYGPF